MTRLCLYKEWLSILVAKEEVFYDKTVPIQRMTMQGKGGSLLLWQNSAYTKVWLSAFWWPRRVFYDKTCLYKEYDCQYHDGQGGSLLWQNCAYINSTTVVIEMAFCFIPSYQPLKWPYIVMGAIGEPNWRLLLKKRDSNRLYTLCI